MVLVSKWAEEVDERHPWQEYPRPQLRREKWQNLNGIWQYQIVQGDEPTKPGLWLDICVPYGVGAPLSYAPHVLEPGEILWYRRNFAARPGLNRIFLNFESIDQCCTVYLNGFEVGSHEGGCIPFSFEVGQYIKYQNALMIKVTDDTDTGIWSFGKQRLQHGGIWYTPTAGITGTVWLEEIGEHAVEDIKITPDYDHRRAYIALAGNFGQAKITVRAEDGSFEHVGLSQDGHYTVPMENFHPWSCEDPFLYDVKVETEDDAVSSYFGMRKFHAGRDASGHMRFFLNDHPMFLTGVLDQGWWPESMVTYPSEAAMAYEIDTMKEMGFNMVRKHMKVESRRWYYECDHKGMLVMQDMPCGGGPFRKWYHSIAPLVFGLRHLKDNDYEKQGCTADRMKAYETELDGMLDMLYNSPCIFAWVPFNEGWGQFDSEEITKRIKAYDTTRLVDSASGWHDQGCGDFNSVHVYFKKFRMPREDGRMVLLSEFGGYSYHSTAHEASEKKFGYRRFKDRLDLDRAVNGLYEKQILPAVAEGLAGCIYTQLADVEEEDNGLLTADRAAVKVDRNRMRKMNEKLKDQVKR
jgi:beta-galactosidase/beta-glucuronidase